MENNLVSSTVRWVRSVNGPGKGVFGGVCAGLAQRLEIDTWLIRAIWLIAILCFGTGLLLYAILAICLPREDDPTQGFAPKISGVCAELARRGDSEPGVIRLLAVFLLLASCGSAILAYFALAIFMPKTKVA